MIRAAIAVLIIALAAEPAVALLWPWEHHRHRHRHVHRRAPALVDCEAVRAVKKRLDEKLFDKALSESTEVQKKNIARCLEEK